MPNRPRGDEQARLDELGNDSGQVGPDSAGQSGDPQRFSSTEDASNESVQELADTEQALEAGGWRASRMRPIIPSGPVHTLFDYGRPEGLPPIPATELQDNEELAERGVQILRGGTVDVEDLVNEKTARGDLYSR